MPARFGLKSLAAVSAMMLAAGTASATVFNASGGGDIPDTVVAGTPGVLTLNNLTVPAGFGPMTFNSITLNFGVGTTTSPRQHTWGADIAATLIAPNGDDSQVMVRVGSTSSTALGDSSDLSGAYTFVNSGGPSFLAAASLATGAQVIPAGTYNRFNNPAASPRPATDADDFTVYNGDEGSGTWTLVVQDWAAGDTGSIAGWSIDITGSGAVPEPTSLGLLAGAAVLPMLRRRRK